MPEPISQLQLTARNNPQQIRHIGATVLAANGGGGGKRDEQKTEEAGMLSKRHCPHTGIVNFFSHADPLLAVGSVSVTGAPASYVWRCYVGEEASGRAVDISLAEAMLRRAIVGSQTREPDREYRDPNAGDHASRSAVYWRRLNDAAVRRSRRSVA